MTLNYKRLFIVWSLFAVVFVQSCSDDPEPIVPGTEGYFIVNEGTFQNSNTSISFYDRETDVMTNDIFAAVNGRPVGDQTQSMTVWNDKGYIMVQNSGKIEVIDADDFTSLATITDDIESPRYMVGISSSKAYVSDWGADGLTGTVKVVDLATNTVVKTIATGHGANRMLKVGDFVYVTNSGGFGIDNTVKIINTDNDEVTNSITVGDNPNSIQIDNNGDIWVASSGAVAYNPDWSVDEENSTTGSISKISDDTEVLRLEVDEIAYGDIASLNVSLDGQTLYYLHNGALYSMSIDATELPESEFVATSYYGLSVDPFSGNIIGTQAWDFISAGSIDVIDAEGNVLDTYTVGIAPNGAAFK